MKRILIIAMLTIAAAAFSACNANQEKAASSTAANAAATPTPSGNVEQEVKQVEQEFVQADLKKDIAWYERHWADELVSTTGRTGKVTNKAEELAGAKDPASVVTSENIEVRQVQAYGDVAVATGKYAVKGKDKDGPFDRHGLFTDVWVKRDGRWQVVASHSSLIPPTTK